MAETDEDSLEDFIHAGAKALALPLDPAWMPAIKANLEATMSHALSVTYFELADEAEPAPIFRA